MKMKLARLVCNECGYCELALQSERYAWRRDDDECLCDHCYQLWLLEHAVTTGVIQ